VGLMNSADLRPVPLALERACRSASASGYPTRSWSASSRRPARRRSVACGVPPSMRYPPFPVRLAAAQVLPRRGIHPRHLVPSHRHLPGDRPADGAHAR
jgi:hypothetical protein